MNAGTTTDVPPLSSPRLPHNFQRHEHLADALVTTGPRDRLAISAIEHLVPTLPNWPSRDQYGKRARLATGVRTILEWLETHPGTGWQERWVSSGADHGTDWIDTLITAGDRRSPRTQREGIVAALSSLLLGRIFLPSYQLLSAYCPSRLYEHARQVFRPDLFEVLEKAGHQKRAGQRRLNFALVVVSKMVLHTGRDVDQLTAEDLLTYRAWRLRHRGRTDVGLGLAWTLLGEVIDLGPHRTLKDAVRLGQRSTAELVDAYNVKCQSIRNLLIRYLDERRPSLDYNTLTALTGILVGTFSCEIERNNPGIETLHLPEEVAAAWKQRIQTVTKSDGTIRPRENYHQVLMRVRGFYLDLHDWARDDPSWAQWSVPSPVRKSDTAGWVKARKKTTAALHQRTRERLPHLPVLVDSAEQHKADQAAFLDEVRRTPIGETLQHAEREYRRTMPAAYQTTYYGKDAPPEQVEDLVTGEIIDVRRNEHEAFWSWAVVEVLQHTGVRIEELLEITHLGLVSYKLPHTGEVVPMLQIVPSKTNEERVLLDPGARTG